MPRIQRLSPSLINKIAAGEVIERPASVVKELMENSVDSGARRIDVAIQQGGLELIRVTDDGCGIAPEDLELAVAPHATSKLASEDDLFHVGTLGFRGEALASIAEVSRFRLRSRPTGATAGHELEVVGGQKSPLVPCGAPEGTSLEVRNLFYNVPVRRKFLRSAQTEMGHISEAFIRIALAAPNCHFTLRHNERTVYELPPSPDWRERIATLFGEDLAAALVAVESHDEDIHLSGYVAHPSQNRANQKMQYLLLNGRAIRDRALHHALGEAYRGLLLSGRHPIAFLALDMPAEMVDVNVHPTKLEVRFLDSGRLYSQLLGTLRTRFLTLDLSNRVDLAGSPPDAAASLDQARAEAVREDFVRWAKGELDAATARVERTAPQVTATLPGLSYPAPHAPAERRPLDLVSLDRPWRPVGPAAAEDPPIAALDEAVADDDSTSNADQPFSPPGVRSANFAPHGPVSALQVHQRYIVTESDEGVVVIDQHALHERILYERLRERVLAGDLETQTLLVPEPVDLSPQEAALVLEQREMLARLGVRVEPFGGSTVLVTSCPAMLGQVQPGEVLRGLLERLQAGGAGPDRRDLLDELLHMMSCKAAIKAGDRLTPEEIASLLADRHLVHDSHHCPHGRPTALVFTREELDRQFLRT
ncbi:MAG: DNA mismatch repair endonuclease MutL [Pirellulales bacterium]|nr:DNA mismatch repair endonuclease MutL [Pirellulales bacterium]